VAWQAKRLGVPAVIVMPRGTPFTKVKRTEALGAEVVLEGETLSDAGAHALALAKQRGLTFVHPYDDPLIMAGQGTVALEMLEARPGLDCLIVPIGGGGLAAGMAVAAKALKPAIEIIGVQCALYPSMRQAIRGEPPTSAGQTLAEGIAVKAPGKLTRPVIERLVDDIVLADEAAIERAVEMMFDEAKQVAEGAGAAPLAALLADRDRFAGRSVGLVLSGGNIDAHLLASILLRGLARAGRMARLRVEISDAPGVLSKVAGVIGDGGGNIIEIYHQRLFYDVPVKFAELDVVIETIDTGHVRAIIDRLNAAGYPARLLGSTADAS
jgi:threonine dehydratase